MTADLPLLFAMAFWAGPAYLLIVVATRTVASFRRANAVIDEGLRSILGPDPAGLPARGYATTAHGGGLASRP